MMMTTMMWIALKSTIILTGACLAGVLMRRASASLRHLLWTAAVTAVLALPLLEASGFRVEVPVPSGWPGTVDGVIGQPAEAEEASDPSGEPEPMTGTRPSVSLATMESRPPNSIIETAREAGGPARTRAAPPRRAVHDHSAAPSDVSGPPSDVDWPAALPWIWVLGVTLWLLVTLRGHWTARRITTRDARPAGPSAHRRLAALLHDTGIRSRVRLVVSRRLEVPATWGLRHHTIVLPERSVGWSSRQLDRVLVHELAHVRRRDCLVQLVGELTRALHWPNPLAWIAVHRLRVESERAADDEVLSRGDAPSAYADDLVELARALRVGPLVPRAALAMAGASGLGGRVRSILDPRRPRGRVRPATVTLAGLGALGLAFSASAVVPVAVAQDGPDLGPRAPVSVEEQADGAAGVRLATPHDDASDARSSGASAWPRHDAQHELPVSPRQELCVFRPDSERRSTSYHGDGDVQRIRWETDDCSVEIDIDGRIEWADDDTGITTMADGAFFEIEERRGRSSTRVRIQRDGGQTERRYWVDGDSRAWSPEADLWLAQILPEVFRHTTINADARVARMLQEGGPDRVFDEVDRIQSEHVARRYLELLMEQADLSTAQYTRIIDYAAGLDSDHSSAELLLAVVQRAGLQPEFQDPMLHAAERLDSDHQKTRVLQTLLESDLSGAQFDAVLRSAQSIESDHNLSQILIAVAEQGGLTASGRAAYTETFASIESDHQLATVMNAFLDAGPLSTRELSQVLLMARQIESDHNLGQVLQRVGEEYPLTGDQVDAYLAAAEGIESDHQLGTVASVILNRADLTSDQLGVVLSLAERIGSDHQRAMVLSQAIERRDLSSPEVERLLRVAEGIGSDHQLASTLMLLVHRTELDGDGVMAVLRLARRIGSDQNQADVLVNLAEVHQIDGEALALYREIAEGLSRHQRNEVLAVIARR